MHRSYSPVRKKTSLCDLTEQCNYNQAGTHVDLRRHPYHNYQQLQQKESLVLPSL
jgi:hypothetical protein